MNRFSPTCCCTEQTCDLFDLDATRPFVGAGFSTDYTPASEYPLASREGGKWIQLSGAQVRYEPPASFTGYDRIGYAASDNTTSGDTWIDVYVNDSTGSTRPTAATATATADEDGPTISIDLSSLVSDTISCVIQSTPLKGSAVMNGATQIDYTPTAGENGEDRFFYRADGPGGVAFGLVKITITPTAGANPQPYTITQFFAEVDDNATLTINEADILQCVLGDPPITWDEIRSPNAKGAWVLGNKYLQADAALPSTGIAILCHGTQTGGFYSVLDSDVSIEVRDGVSVISKLERIDTDTLTIQNDAGTLTLDYTGDGTIASASLFHELVITHTATQSRRYSATDAFGYFPTLATFSDGSTRERKTDASLQASHRMNALIPATSKARIANGDAVDTLVGAFTGTKVIDELENKNTTCPDGRAVCTIIQDNHVQQWTTAITADGAAFGTAENRQSYQCTFTESSPFSGGGQTDGYIRQDWYQDEYDYNVGIGSAIYQDQHQVGAHSTVGPTFTPYTTNNYTLTVIPLDIGGGNIRLQITLAWDVAGVTWNGTQLNGQTPSSHLVITPSGDNLEIEGTFDEDSIAFSLSRIATTTGPAGQTYLGRCNPYTPGSNVDEFITAEFDKTDRQTERYEAPLTMQLGFAQFQAYWEVDVPNWSDASPSVGPLTGAAATITPPSHTFYKYASHSTTEDSATFPAGIDAYTPHTSNPVGTAKDEVVSAPGTPCPLGTGTAITKANTSYQVRVTENYTLYDPETVSLTLTGST